MTYITKNIKKLFILTLLLCGNVALAQDKTINVGVFKGFGGAVECVEEAYYSCLIDPDMKVNYITPEQLATSQIKQYDIIIIPGGSGSKQYLDMGGYNRNKLKSYVSQGGSLMGICAGAYMLSSTPEYSCLSMSGAQAIDIEHDNRGHGLCKVALSEEGKKIFPELSGNDIAYMMYYEGPVLIPHNSGMPYETMAVMKSDVHSEGGAPAGMTTDKPFIIKTNYDKGKVISIVGHPEATPGMQWTIPRLIRYTLNKKLIPYSAQAVAPNVYGKEIICTEAMLKEEKAHYKKLIYGNAEEKLKALEYFDKIVSWDAKEWIKGLLFDDDARVKIRTAELIVKCRYLRLQPALSAAAIAEKDPATKKTMMKMLTELNKASAQLQ
ncbi:BPL-N domain-containing protein [Porphyromonas pogonae]|uniref:BPL-N domain-containing protein n=1 Tax=Porphyromonas pogonae TaxID=867595 RepID=UPI002E76939B|nr:BPL-N domain-containing protein [Porphyromonas pogonae]